MPKGAKKFQKGQKVPKKKCMKLLKTDKWGKKFQKKQQIPKKCQKGPKSTKNLQKQKRKEKGLWTEIWPSRVHNTNRDPVMNRYTKKGSFMD